jgi:hypothetical protein
MKHRHPEHDIQAACIRWCAYHETAIPALVWLHAIPNGGARHPAVAMKLKAEGVKKGIPDLFLPYPCGGKHGLYIEVKSAKGRLTPEQTVFSEYAIAHGYGFAVVHDVPEFIDAIFEYVK